MKPSEEPVLIGFAGKNGRAALEGIRNRLENDKGGFPPSFLKVLF